jgi:NAD-dependent deacetylase
MRKKIAIFTGAGISKESGVETFRDSKDGLWENHNIEDVCTMDGWRKDREKVLNFYNDRRRQLPTVEPNDAHKGLVRLEDSYDVTIITQNVDDLHERAGSTNIIHLHGELTKARGSLYNHKPSPVDNTIDIGYKDINIGDKCPVTGSQLRPHIVWFGEYPFNVGDAYDVIYNADILIIIGTSLQISYTLGMLNNVKRVPEQCEIYYIDPSPMHYLDNYGLKVNYVNKSATEGVTELVEKLLKN